MWPCSAFRKCAKTASRLLSKPAVHVRHTYCPETYWNHRRLWWVLMSVDRCWWMLIEVDEWWWMIRAEPRCCRNRFSAWRPHFSFSWKVLLSSHCTRFEIYCTQLTRTTRSLIRSRVFKLCFCCIHESLLHNNERWWKIMRNDEKQRKW